MNYNNEFVELVTCERRVIYSQVDPEVLIEKRELLEIVLKGEDRDKTATVIMMNPSKANEEESDGTVDKLINYFYGNQIESNGEGHGEFIKVVKVVNLFPIINPKSGGLHKGIDDLITYSSVSKLKKIMEKNRDVIEKSIVSSDFIFLGWGNCPEYFHITTYYHQVNYVLKTLRRNKRKNVFVFKVSNNRAKAQGRNSENILTNSMNPVHPANGPINGIVNVKIDSLYRIIPFT